MVVHKKKIRKKSKDAKIQCTSRQKTAGSQERDREDKKEIERTRQRKYVENYMNCHTVHKGKTGRLKYNFLDFFFLNSNRITQKIFTPYSKDNLTELPTTATTRNNFMK